VNLQELSQLRFWWDFRLMASNTTVKGLLTRGFDPEKDVLVLCGGRFY
jgi:hypothetical protein